MRYLFTLTLILSFFIATKAHAVVYPLSATINGQVITVTMSGVTDTMSDFNLFDGNTPVPAPEAVNTSGMIKKATNGSVIWEIKGAGFKNDYRYYLNAKKISPGIVLAYEPVTNVVPFKTGTGGNNIFYTWPTVTNATGQKADIKGQIDLTKYPNIANLKIELKLSLTPGISNPNTYQSQTANGATTSYGIAPDGSYYWNLTGLTPSTTYYIQQNIYEGTNTTPITTEIDKFDSSKGYLPEGSQAANDAFASRTYRLLAPWPGLAVLMDPDLCDQQKVEGKLPPGAICDINGLINFAFKMLIGLTALVLVFRLIFEGYSILTSDVPFIHAKAKEGFKGALLGLLLALSAYLILNTINPKLVSNNINLASVEVGVEIATFDPVLYKTLTGQNIKAKPEYVNLANTLSQQKSIDACIVKATITVESNWIPNIIGCDENVHGSDVPSRKAFVGSGIKLDGTTFTGSSANNNCPKNINSSQAGYGLDWRFSKGGGLMQITKFPPGYKTQAWYEGVKQGGSYWNSRTTPFAGWQAVLVPETNVNEGISLLKNGLQTCGSIEGAFRKYQGGSCNSSGQIINASVAKKMTEYQICKSKPTTYAL